MRRFVLEADINPVPSGLVAYRTVIPFEEITAKSSLSWVTTNPEALGLVTAAAAGDHRSLAVYPCRDGTLLNIAATHPDARTDDAEKRRSYFRMRTKLH